MLYLSRTASDDNDVLRRLGAVTTTKVQSETAKAGSKRNRQGNDKNCETIIPKR